MHVLPPRDHSGGLRQLDRVRISAMRAVWRKRSPGTAGIVMTANPELDTALQTECVNR